MPLFTWDSSYSVRVRKLDEQHKVLFETINRLFDSMYEGRGSDVIASVASDLVNYTSVHFRAEEEMMRETNFPTLLIHQAQHKQFEEMVQKLVANLKGSGRTNFVDLLQFLRDWLTKHIKETDKNYSAFVNARGYV